MKPALPVRDRRRKVAFVLFVLLVVMIVRWVVQAFADDPEIALIYGEPWEDMRQRSSAAINPAIPDETGFRIPKTDARLRYIHPQYGFDTPLARFFTISFEDERVSSIRMSPQIEPLLLDDALKIVLDLQDQWRRKGWELTSPNIHPAIADNRAWRARLRDINKGGTTYWQADDTFQIMLILHRFKDDRHPDEERYLISLSIGNIWVPREKE
ncbi:hypothetical protein [Pseudomonas helleri]|uniref:hypothetical protein n=1 Tax=Pseudomonas helleri TaxID=1608996 RepID=UPI003CC881E3